jgi:hypothetical protein
MHQNYGAWKMRYELLPSRVVQESSELASSEVGSVGDTRRPGPQNY